LIVLRPPRLLSFLHPSSPSLIHTLSLHDALPISFSRLATHQTGRSATERTRVDEGPRSLRCRLRSSGAGARSADWRGLAVVVDADRKSTLLNSSHVKISYAVFCLKKNRTHPLTHD